MKKTIAKRAWSAFLALAIMVATVFGNVTTAKAATTTLFESADEEYVIAGQELTYDFTLDQDSTVAVYIMVVNPCDMQIAMYNGAGTLLDCGNENPHYVYASDFVYYEGCYAYIGYIDMVAGDYKCGLKFASENYVLVGAEATTAAAKISQDTATITKGFTKKLTVSNGTVKKWSSSKPAVASVDSKGKVTAKKTGTAKITATMEDGSKLTCTVKVKDNKYSRTKITTSDVAYNSYGAEAYSASFDAKGNLVVKVMIVNGGYGRMAKIPNFKVTVKDQNGKKVGTYSKSSFKVSVSSYSAKSYTVTIKKSSKLSAKKVDLRNSDIIVDGGTATVYY